MLNQFMRAKNFPAIFVIQFLHHTVTSVHTKKFNMKTENMNVMYVKRNMLRNLIWKITSNLFMKESRSLIIVTNVTKYFLTKVVLLNIRKNMILILKDINVAIVINHFLAWEHWEVMSISFTWRKVLTAVFATKVLSKKGIWNIAVSCRATLLKGI